MLLGKTGRDLGCEGCEPPSAAPSKGEREKIKPVVFWGSLGTWWGGGQDLGGQ